MNKKVEEKKVVKKAPAKKPTTKKKIAKKAPVTDKKIITSVKEEKSCSTGSCKIGGKCPCMRFLCKCGCKSKALVLAIVALLVAFFVVQVVESKVSKKANEEIQKAAEKNGFIIDIENTDYNLFSKNFYMENATISLAQAPGVNIFVAEASINSGFIKMFDENFKYELPKESGTSENYIKGLTVNEDLLFAMGIPNNTYIDIHSLDDISKENVYSEVKVKLNNFAEIVVNTNINELEKYVAALNKFAKESKLHQNDNKALEKDFEEFFAGLYIDFASFSYKDMGVNEFMAKINPNYEYEKDMQLVEIKHAKDLSNEQKMLLNNFVKNPSSVNISWNNNTNISVKELIDTVKAKTKGLDKLNSGFTVQLNGQPLFTEEAVIEVQEEVEPAKVEGEAKVEIKVTPETKAEETEEVKK